MNFETAASLRERFHIFITGLGTNVFLKEASLTLIKIFLARKLLHEFNNI